MTVRFGPFTFDRANGLLREGARELPLPPRVLGVLDLLVSRPGEIVPKQELIDTVWKEAFVTDTSLAEAVSVLRQALRDDAQSATYVQTVHRRGYRFVAPVIPSVPGAAANDASPSVSTERVSPSIGGQLIPWSVATLCSVLALAALWQYTHFRPPVPPVVRMVIEPATGTVFDDLSPIAISPDGTTVVWSACDSGCRLYLRRVDALETRAIPGTDGAHAPFFSPDSRWIGFFAGGSLRKVSVSGGMSMAVTDAAQPFGAVWTPDGQIVFSASRFGGLLRVSDRGGDPEPLTAPSPDAGELGHAWPALAPGGKGLLFTIATSPLDAASGRIALLPLGQPGAWQTIVDAADRAAAAGPDYVAFSRNSEIHAVAFDRTRQAVSGAEQVVVSGTARGQLAVSQSGAMAYAAASEPGQPTLEWEGAPVRTTFPPEINSLQTPALSSDGSRIAGILGDDVWVGDVARGTTTRVTHGGINAAPVWTADLEAIYYAASKGGPFEIWRRDASATRAATQVLSAAARHRHLFPTSISGDGRLLAYTESGGPTRGDVVVVALADTRTVATVQTPFDEINGKLSSDGRLLAYQSDESGRWEIYIHRVADGHRVSVSGAGGTDPLWGPGDRMLTYRAGDRLVRVSVDDEGIAGAEATRMPLGTASLVGVDTAGRVLIRRPGERPPSRAVLTLEWARELRALLGPPAARLPR